jgi:3-oxoadipate enol-lactonase
MSFASADENRPEADKRQKTELSEKKKIYMPKVKVNDININYEVRGEGFPAVMINGLGGTMENWTIEPRLLNAVSANHKTVVFDNRGAGETDISDKQYSMELLAQDTVGLMDALGIEKAHIIGGSMGGMIAQYIGILYPDRVGKLVMMATFPGGPRSIRPVPELWEYATVAGKGNVGDLKTVNPFLLMFSPKTLAEMPQEALDEIASAYFNVRQLNAGFAGQQRAIRDMDCADRLKEIKAETLVISGKYDLLMPPENGVLIAKEIPNSRFVLLENSAHAMIEETDYMVTLVSEFLAS